MKIDTAPAWWTRRPLRERLLLALATVAALGALADALLSAPLARRLHRGQAGVQALESRWQALQERALGQAEQSRQEADQRRALHERLAAAQQRAQAQARLLADTTRLPETLRAIVGTVGSARLVELELGNDTAGAAAAAPVAAVAPVAASSALPAATPAWAGAAGRRLYHLPITLKVSGTWSELQFLLAQVERHAEALQWQSLTLDNSEWPSIGLTLKAHVASLQPRWGAAS